MAANKKRIPFSFTRMPELDPPNTPTDVAVCSTMPTLLTLFFYIVMTRHARRGCAGRPQVSRRRVAAGVEGECSICLSEYPVGSYMLFLPCGHSFHSRCLTRWLSRSHTCPLCRASCAEDAQSP